MARKSSSVRTFVVTVSAAMRIDADGQRTDWKVILPGEPLTAAQIAASLVGGDAVVCDTCGDEVLHCPVVRRDVERKLPATRAEFVRINARNGVSVVPAV